MTVTGPGMPAQEAGAGILSGKRVLVTRRAEQAGELTQLLIGHGAEVVEVPMIRIEPPTDIDTAVSAIEAFARYDYVVFTSVNAVAAVKILARERGVDLSLPGPVVFGVGPATAEALGGAGMVAEALRDDFTANGLLKVLASWPLDGRRVLLPRSEVGREELPAALRRIGALVDDVAVYLTKPDPDAPGLLRKVLATLDVVTFASGSAVAAFGAAVPAGWQRPPGLLVAVIGSTTAAAARVVGLEPDIVAAEHTAPGLAEVVAAYFERT